MLIKVLAIVTLAVSQVNLVISAIIVYADPGDNVTLPCNLKDNMVIWHGIGGYQYSQGTAILTSLPQHLKQRLFIVEEDGFGLHIKDIKQTDEGGYTCSDQNDTVSVSLVFKVPPKAVNFLNESEGWVVTDEDKTVTIICEAIGGQPPPHLSIYWRVNQMVTGDGPNLTLTIKPKREDDLTNLTCIANHTLMDDELTTTATFKLNLSPLALRMNDRHVLYEGTTANFFCLSTGSRPPAEIEWFVNDMFHNASSVENTLAADETYNVRSVLEFDPERTHNKGIIACRTFNRTSQKEIEITQELEVYFPPSLSIESEEVGDTRILHCRPDGNPKIYEFTSWRHSSLFNETIREFDGSQNGILEISKSNTTAVYEDSGTYTCYVKNGIPDSSGRLMQRGSIDLNYEDSPKLTLNNKSKYYWTAGEEVVITQTYLSYPEPAKEEWYKLSPLGELKPLDALKYTTLSTPATVLDLCHGKIVHKYGYISTLTIKSMSVIDQSDFMLVVENRQGNISSIIQLIQSSKVSGAFAENELSIGATAIAMLSVGSILILLNLGFFILNVRHRKLTKSIKYQQRSTQSSQFRHGNSSMDC